MKCVCVHVNVCVCMHICTHVFIRMCVCMSCDAIHKVLPGLYLSVQCVGVVARNEGQWGDVELGKLLHGLLHPPSLALLLCVRVLHNQR